MGLLIPATFEAVIASAEMYGVSSIVSNMQAVEAGWRPLSLQCEYSLAECTSGASDKQRFSASHISSDTSEYRKSKVQGVLIEQREH